MKLVADNGVELARRVPSVLNAFRHQWFFRNLLNVRDHAAHECSTPFGINGSFASSRPGEDSDADVCAQRLSASMVLSRGKSARLLREVYRAQRLSASMV